MRDKKFRAWDIIGKVMLDWSCLRQTAFNQLSIHDQHKAKNIFVPLMYKAFTNPNFTMLQYTGLKDKNGKEIYEGDILTSKSNVLLFVEWYRTGFVFKIQHTNSSMGMDGVSGVCEIIGNIYEHKNLLNGK